MYGIRIEQISAQDLTLKVVVLRTNIVFPFVDYGFFMYMLAEEFGDWDSFEQAPPLANEVLSYYAPEHNSYDTTLLAFLRATHYMEPHPYIEEVRQLEEYDVEYTSDEQYAYHLNEETGEFGDNELELSYARFRLRFTNSAWIVHLQEGMAFETNASFE